MLAKIECKKPHVGMTFNSYDELEKFMENFMNTSKQIFVKQKTNPGGPNSKEKKILKAGIKYYSINYVCKHGRRKDSPTQTIRK